jgi:hypothetical protein
MRGREFIGLLGMAAIDRSRAAIAQTSARIYHHGTISPGAPILDTSSNGKSSSARSRSTDLRWAKI